MKKIKAGTTRDPLPIMNAKISDIGGMEVQILEGTSPRA
jgi:hypothetical protein